MKEAFKFSYNLNINDIEEYNNYLRFKLNNNYFYFVPLIRSEKELTEIIDCSRELKQRGIECHDILLNKQGSAITKVGEVNYVLLKINGEYQKEYALTEILEISDKLVLTSDKVKLYKNNWSKMWADKIDYYEYQVSELAKNKKGVLNSFSYYVGMAENAISYVNDTMLRFKQTEIDKITLCHRRFFYPNIKLNFLNPLCFIFDLEVRDTAEYIKMLFFYSDEDAITELDLYLKLHKLTPYSYQMFYARLLFPTYYFDVYEKIINNECDDDELIRIVSKVDEYELFLKRVFILISRYYPIEKVEWILKKEL